MEPVVADRSDSQAIPRESASRCCRNGAGRCRPERLVAEGLGVPLGVEAAMEPVVADRSDPPAGTWPQGRSCRRNGAGRCRPERPRHSPHGLRSLTCRNGAGRCRPERQPDKGPVDRRGGAAMEPVVADRSDRGTPGRPDYRLRAAMEPVVADRSDLRHDGHAGADRPPQWSRSLPTGATTAMVAAMAVTPMPQWSRSLPTGATRPYRPPVPLEQRPQWSRSLPTGATTCRGPEQPAPQRAAMEPVVADRSDRDRLALLLGEPAAAMEPVVADRSDSSQKLGVLSCEDVAFCERSAEPSHHGHLYGGVKMLKQALTCVRALPGDWVTTTALATPGGACDHDGRRIRRQRLQQSEADGAGQRT